MPANVETMFSVKETPWHGLGVVLNDPPTVEEGIRRAGMDWEVGFRPLITSDTKEAVSHRAVYRKDNNKILGVVGPRYVPLQNVKKFDFFQPFLDAKECSLETAGVLDEGRKTWILAKLNRDNSVIVKGDEVAKFLMLSDSFDGTSAVRVGFTPIRIVCANTLAAAHRNKESNLLRVRHSSQTQTNLDKIQEIVNTANAEFEATAEQYRFLASRQVNAKDLEKYVTIILKLQEKKDSKEGGLTTRSKNILEAVLKDFDGGLGNQLPGVKGTWWAGYNGVTQYLNYERGHNPSSRLDSLWFGDSANISERALALAVAMADGKETPLTMGV